MDFKTVNKWEPRMWSEANMEVPTEADSKKKFPWKSIKMVLLSLHRPHLYNSFKVGAFIFLLFSQSRQIHILFKHKVWLKGDVSA